jgi:hypothetical protein
VLVAVATAADGEPLLLNGDKLTAETKTTALQFTGARRRGGSNRGRRDHRNTAVPGEA